MAARLGYVEEEAEEQAEAQLRPSYAYDAERALAEARRRLAEAEKLLAEHAELDVCCSLCGKTRREFAADGQRLEDHVTSVKGVIVIGNKATGERAPGVDEREHMMERARLERDVLIARAHVKRLEREVESRQGH